MMVKLGFMGQKWHEGWKEGYGQVQSLPGVGEDSPGRPRPCRRHSAGGWACELNTSPHHPAVGQRH